MNSLDWHNVGKVDLISKSFSLWLKSPKGAKNYPELWALNTYSALFTNFKKGAQPSDLVPSSGNLIQSEKLSEIKPPLDDVVFWGLSNFGWFTESSKLIQRTFVFS